MSENQNENYLDYLEIWQRGKFDDECCLCNNKASHKKALQLLNKTIVDLVYYCDVHSPIYFINNLRGNK